MPFSKLEQWKLVESDGTDLGEELQKYFIPDFSSWKDHDSYRTAFERLMKDLKAGTSGPGARQTVANG